MLSHPPVNALTFWKNYLNHHSLFLYAFNFLNIRPSTSKVSIVLLLCPFGLKLRQYREKVKYEDNDKKQFCYRRLSCLPQLNLLQIFKIFHIEINKI